MELKTEEFSVAEKIDFNFQELKTDVSNALAHYKNIVYTDEQLPEAKKDLAQMRKFVSVLDDERKRVKKALLMPYNDFEAKINEIKALVGEPIALVDGQVKEFESQKKEEKLSAIIKYYEDMTGGKVEEKYFDHIFNPSWLNTSYSMAKIEKEISDAVIQYDNDMTTLLKLKDYQFEAINEYKISFDLGKAIETQMLCRERAEQKAEYVQQNIVGGESERTWIGFQAHLNSTEATLLKEFFKNYHIDFKPLEISEKEN